MNMDIVGKTAFVTGAASGIGLATAVAMARRGAAIALADVSAPALDEAERAVRAAGAPRVTKHLVDVAKAEQVEQAAADALKVHGGVEIAFANAGVGFIGVPITQTRLEDARWLMDVNFMGVFHTARALLPSMIASGKPGAFLCTSSLAALFNGPGGHGAFYSGSKCGVVALAQGIEDECGAAPIKVSVIYPGPIVTNIEANVVTLRPRGGAEAPTPQALLDMTKTLGIPASAAADIILQGLEAGVGHIFTHPDISEMVHRQYSQMILGGIDACRRFKNVHRQTEPAA